MQARNVCIMATRDAKTIHGAAMGTRTNMTTGIGLEKFRPALFLANGFLHSTGLLKLGDST